MGKGKALCILGQFLSELRHLPGRELLSRPAVAIAARRHRRGDDPLHLVSVHPAASANAPQAGHFCRQSVPDPIVLPYNSHLMYT
ncbi:MAG: hypothetical protein WC651_03270 [Candidatus Gracilibacteria bacterium]